MAKYSELSFFKERVQIRIEGFRIDHLLDKSFRNGIHMKAVQVKSETELVCWISAEELKHLRRLAKSAYRITILKSHGPAPFVRNFIRKPGLVLGCLIVCIMVGLQGYFIETIQINGYGGIPEEELLACLAEEGIVRGALRTEIDWAKAEDKIYDTFPQVTWAQLVYSGRMVILNISETNHDVYGIDVPSERTDEHNSENNSSEERKYTDVVAACDGYVEEIQAYWGKAMVEKGDYVEAGQILISGRMESEKLEGDYLVNAKGQVWAIVPYSQFFMQERYLWGADASENESENAVVNKVEKTEAQAKKKAEQQIRAWAKENLPENAEIVKKSLKFSADGNIIKVSVLFEVRQQIGIQQEEFIGTEITDTRDNRQD